MSLKAAVQVDGPAPFLRALPAAPARRIRILDADPELGAGLKPDELPQATASAVAAAAVVAAGRWEPACPSASRGHLGIMVLDGLLARRVTVGEAEGVELVGDGDLVRPSTIDEASGPVPCHVRWEVLRPSRIALLDASFARAIAPWPELMGALIERAARSTHSRSLQIAIGHLNRVEPRLIALLWHLADRWGRVTPAGVVVALPLTHTLLADLIGARRPSVTTALNSMIRAGTLVRRDDGFWVLPLPARDALERLCISSGAELS